MSTPTINRWARSLTASATALLCALLLLAVMPTAMAIDEVKPYVVKYSPSDGTSGIPTDVAITVDFSENVRSDNLASYITLYAGSVVVAKRIVYDNVTFRATIVPIDPLKYSMLYQVMVSQLIQDLAGNSLERAVQWRFNTTHEKVPPVVTSSNPRPGEADVSINSTIRVMFSETMDLASLSMEIRDAGGTPVIGNVTKAEDALSMVFEPLFALGYGEVYTVTVPKTAKDLAGNTMVADHVFTFTAQLERIRPRVVELLPIEGTVLVPRNQEVSARFSEPMNATSLAGSVMVTSASGDTIPTTPYYDSINYILTIQPNILLKYQTFYTVTVQTVARDLAGNYLDREYVTTFTTVPIPQQMPALNGWSPQDLEFDWFEGQAAPFIIVADDPNGDILVYTWSVNGEVKEGETFETFTFYPEPGSEGRYKIEVAVSDGLTTPAKHFWIVNVIAPPGNGGQGGDDPRLFTAPVIMLIILIAIVSMVLVYYYLHLMDRRREILARTRRRLRPMKLARDLGPKEPPSYEEMYLRPDGIYARRGPEFRAVNAPKTPTTMDGAGRMSTVETGPIMGDAPKLIDAKEVEVRRAEVGPVMTRTEIGKRTSAVSRLCPKCGGKVIEAAHGRLWCDEHGWV